jgi:hypothetical protein
MSLDGGVGAAPTAVYVVAVYHRVMGGRYLATALDIVELGGVAAHRHARRLRSGCARLIRREVRRTSRATASR